MQFLKNHSRTNALMASIVFAISFIVYFFTMSPSICLWDCGEYLAASADLGLPHPPGTPFLILIGRAWLVLFSFVKDVGFRYNLLSIVSSAVTVVFIYLIIIRALTMVLGEPDTLWKRLTYYCAGFVGSLYCAFGNTFWFESLEGSEQSNITNVPVALTIWLTLVWAQSKSIKKDRVLLLIAYVAFLCIGMHMISMITMPAIFLFVMIYDKEKRNNWRLWIACISLGLIMYNLSYFLVVAPIVTGWALIMMFASKNHRPHWRFCFWFCFLALLGFSNHFYLPIRSALNPLVDEGHPVDMKSLKDVLDRKQYGSESMVSRSLWRRGSFAHQFGIEGHMGYGGFHLTQFFRFGLSDAEKNFVDGSPSGYGKLLLYLLPTFLVLLGWYLMSKKNRKVATFLIFMTLLTTVLMIWYMNFSDGTRAEHSDYQQWVRAGQQGPMPTVHREVRVRDYFYSAGFMFFSMWIGLAAGLILHRLFSEKKSSVRKFAPIAFVFFLISPALPLSQNYKLRDRSQNWAPFEYAYNLLMSCEKNGILITNGDNDTFPLWAIQEAYGIRTDVRLVNLSLVNTDWYIKQLKKLEPKVPISFTESQIERLQPELNPFENPTPIELPGAKIQLVVPGRAQQQVLRVLDKIVLNIVDANKWEKPVYFACTVSPDNFMGLDSYLQMQGMVYRIMPRQLAQNERIDMDRIENFMNHVCKLRPYPDRRTDVDEAYMGIYNDYVICFMWLSMQLQERMAGLDHDIKDLKTRMNDPAMKKSITPQDSIALTEKYAQFTSYFDRVVSNLDRCIGLMPWNMQPVLMRQQILIKFDKAAMAEERARKLIAMYPDNAQLRSMLVQALEAQGKQKEAQEFLQKG
jgi:hypothetical protein